MSFTIHDTYAEKVLGVYETRDQLDRAMERLSYEDGELRYVVVEDKPKRKPTTKKAKTNVETKGD